MRMVDRRLTGTGEPQVQVLVRIGLLKDDLSRAARVRRANRQETFGRSGEIVMRWPGSRQDDTSRSFSAGGRANARAGR